MQSAIQQSVEQEVYDSLFPRRDVERPSFSVEVVLEANRRPEMERLVAQMAVYSVETIEAAGREIVQRLPICGNTQSFSPEKQRLGVYANCCFVEVRLAIDVAPANQTGRVRHIPHEWQ